MRRLLGVFFDFLLLVAFIPSLWGAYIAFQYYFPKGITQGGLSAGLARFFEDAGRLVSYAQVTASEARHADGQKEHVPQMSASKLN